MNDKLTKVIGLIKDGLQYSETHPDKDGDDYGVDKVELYEETIRSASLSREDIDGIFRNLRKAGVIKLQQIFYAPDRTVSNYETDTKYKVPADDFYKNPVYVLHINRQKLDELHATPTKKGLPDFDDLKGNVVIGGVSCHIADKGDYQYHLCKELLTVVSGKSYKIGDWLSEGYLEDAYSPPLTGESAAFKSGRWVKDAVYKINDKIQNCFHIEKFMEYRKANVRIATENFK